MEQRQRQRVIIMIGVSGSGKTTFVSGRLPGYAHISLDINGRTLPPHERRMLVDRYEAEDPLRLKVGHHTPPPTPPPPLLPRNPAVRHPAGQLSRLQGSGNRKAEYIQIADALAAGRNVVVDDTNLTREVRWPHIVLAKIHGASIEGVQFLDVAGALDRNKGRTGRERVPDDVMRRQIGMMEWPDASEGFESIITI